MGKTYAYTYDKAGNIRSKKTYAYTTGTLGTAQSSIIYRYNTSGWKDQLKKYDGVELTYDATGNPLTHYNGAEYTFTWKNGRELATSAKDGVTTTYTYDESGNRISKQVGNVTHTYVYEGSQLISDSFSGKYVVYIYDESGSPAGMEWHENNTVSKYAFEKNLHGDIVGIYTYAGTKVVTYKYDAWGNCTTTYSSGYQTVAENNIYRYRGYIYDVETGFYWLRTRYYDPVIGRFINADSLLNGGDELQGYNMYAYCGNNPVMGYDPNGTFSWDKLINGSALLAIGLIACTTALTAVSGGACAPLMVLACATFVAGGMTVLNGASEIIESVTDYNPMRDTVMGGNETAYNIQKNSFATAAVVGTSLLSLNTGLQCFVEGTPVLTDDGLKPIESLMVGEFVLSANPYESKIEYKEIIHLYRSEVYDLVLLTVDNEVITTTPNHPFWTEEYGWLGAEYLTPDCSLRLSNGEVFHVEKVELQHLNSPVSVYNIEVEDFHSYFVGDSGILVHNRNSWDPETTDTIRDLLSGMGQLRNLQNNPNLKGVNINYLLSKTPGELMQMAKSGEITNKTLKQIKKAFEGRDLGTKGRKC